MLSPKMRRPMQPHPTNYLFLPSQLALGKKIRKGGEATEKCGWIERGLQTNAGRKKNIKRMKGT